MKVLWITNLVFPEALQLLTGNGDLRASGGWLLGAAESLVQTGKVQLAVATVTPMINTSVSLLGKNIQYYLLPNGSGNQRKNDEYRKYWRAIVNEYNPDVVHIHGTEYSHGLSYVDECGSKNVCVSIQGLVGVYSRYYYEGLTISEIKKSATIASVLKNGILKGCRNFKRRGRYEKELLERVGHIIGRTSWDRAHAWAINPQARYHYGGEILRMEFYDNSIWQYQCCIPHSIFVSQATLPLKGLHQILRAMPLVLRLYPDATLRVAGPDITRSRSSWMDTLKLSDWGKIVRRLIRENHLQEKVIFTGALNAEEMKQEYLKSNVFVCPSSIENSPNSLGEAQILGVPVIASYVGGTMDMMRGDEDHLYRFEEVEMLAEKICLLFASEENQPQVGLMRQHAIQRHGAVQIIENLMAIYHKVINS